MYSVVVEGKVLDVRYKRLGNGLQAVYVGDIYIGQVVKLRSGWSSIGKDPHQFNLVNGFASRETAMEFLLRLAGLRDK